MYNKISYRMLMRGKGHSSRRTTEKKLGEIKDENSRLKEENCRLKREKKQLEEQLGLPF